MIPFKSLPPITKYEREKAQGIRRESGALNLKSLSPRHMKIISYHIAGVSNNDIARAMCLTPSRVSLVLSDPLAQRIAAAHPELGLTIMPDPMPEERLFLRSDHFSFARRNIPALFFTTGLHDDYHRPSDTADLIDADKISRIARLAFHLALAVGNDPEPPTWTDEGRSVIRAVTGGGEN
jgi:Zn-dependent M28 family amino/carboxypeptidase